MSGSKLGNILVAWELGHNFGHTLPLLPVAVELRDMGHSVAFVVKELRQVSSHLRARGFAVLQGPFHPDPFIRSDHPQPQSMADILQHVGYGDKQHLRAYVQAWRDMMEVFDADLVVASFAPTALLAARTLGLRTCLVGMPFEVPPPVRPCPPMRTWLDVAPSMLVDSDRKVVSNVNEAVRDHGVHIDSTFEIFRSDRQLLWTFPELDHHLDHRNAVGWPAPEYTGGVFTDALGGPPQWPESSLRKVFGYVRYPMPRMTGLVRALGAADASFCIVNPLISDADASSLRCGNVVVLNRPVRLGDMLDQCCAVLNYGGHGTVCASLMRGRPLIVVAEQMDGVCLGLHIAKQHLAVMANPHSPGAIADACSFIVKSDLHLNAASDFHARYSTFDVHSQTRRFASSIAATLAPANAS